MDTKDILKKIENNTIDYTLIGNHFFARTTSAPDKKAILSSMLNEQQFENIARVMHMGTIDKQYADNDISALNNEFINIDARYFTLLTEICAEILLDQTKLIPLCVCAYKSKVGSVLYKWLHTIEEFIYTKAQVDYDSVLDALTECDTDYVAYSGLLRADKGRTREVLLDRLLRAKNTNKIAIRKFLYQNKVDVFSVLAPIYDGLPAKERNDICKLLVLYKNNREVSSFLNNISKYEKSKAVHNSLNSPAIKQVDLDDIKVKVSNKYSFDSEYNCVTSFSSKAFAGSITIDQELNITASVKPSTPQEKKYLNARISSVTKDIEIKSDELKKMMVSSLRFTYSEFNERILKNDFTSLLASTLFFGVYKNGVLYDIIIIHNNKLNDLQNNDYTLPEDATIGVLHAIEIPSTHAHLKNLGVVQAFDQVNRKCYEPTEYEKSSNCIERINGTIISVKDFLANIRKYGYKILSRDRENVASNIGVVIEDTIMVLNFNGIDLTYKGTTITLLSARFYDLKNLVKVRGQIYLDNIISKSINTLSATTFSEFLYLLHKVGNIGV